MPEERRWLGFFILLSFLLHFSTFFLFHSPVDFASHIHRTSLPHVTLLSNAATSLASAQNSSAWMDIFDPRLLALPTQQDASDPHERSSNPSLDNKFLTSLPLPNPLSVDSAAPAPFGKTANSGQRALESLSLVQADPKPIIVESPPRVRGTRVNIHGPLATREITHRTEMPQPQSAQTLQATILRIAVDPSGLVTHIFIDEKCGDSNVDAQAVNILRDWRFAPLSNNGELQWGRVNVFWDLQAPATPGNDKETP